VTRDKRFLAFAADLGSARHMEAQYVALLRESGSHDQWSVVVEKHRAFEGNTPVETFTLFLVRKDYSSR
jgi:hypothetical protein